jgi:hypothetical protein
LDLFNNDALTAFGRFHVQAITRCRTVSVVREIALLGTGPLAASYRRVVSRELRRRQGHGREMQGLPGTLSEGEGL